MGVNAFVLFILFVGFATVDQGTVAVMALPGDGVVAMCGGSWWGHGVGFVLLANTSDSNNYVTMVDG
jgi:hypothetical protein